MCREYAPQLGSVKIFSITLWGLHFSLQKTNSTSLLKNGFVKDLKKNLKRILYLKSAIDWNQNHPLVISANRLLAMTEKITISIMSEVIYFFQIWLSECLGGQNPSSPDLNGPSFFFRIFTIFSKAMSLFCIKRNFSQKFVFCLKSLLGAIPHHSKQMKWSNSVLQLMKSIFSFSAQNV